MRRGWGSVKPPVGAQVDSNHPLARRLSACWGLLEGGGLIVFDSGPAHNNGTITGTGTAVSWSAAQFGTAMTYTATTGNRRVDFSTTLFDFEFSDLFSIEVWVLCPDASTVMNLCGNYAGTSNAGIALTVNDITAGAFTFNAKNTSLKKIVVTTPNTVVSAGRWHHVVVTNAGTGVASGVHIYVNGVDQSLTVNTDALASSSIKTGNNWTLGRSGVASGTGSTIGAKYATHRIWNRVLSAQEVRQLYVAPFEMFSSNKRRNVFSPTSGTTYNVSLSMNAAFANSQSANLTIPVSVSLATAHVVSPSATLTINPTATLNAAFACSQSAVATIGCSLSMNAVFAMAQSANLTIPASVSLAFATALSSSAFLTIPGSVSMNAVFNTAQSTQLTMNPSLFMNASMGMSQSGSVTMLTSSTLNFATSFSPTATMIMQTSTSMNFATEIVCRNGNVYFQDCALNFSAGMSQSAQLTMNPSVSLGVVSNMSQSANLIISAGIQLMTMHGMLQTGGKVIPCALTLNAVQNMSQSAGLTIQCSVALGVQMSQSQLMQLTMNPAISLDVKSSMSASNTMVMNASMSLATNMGLSAEATLQIYQSLVLPVFFDIAQSYSVPTGHSVPYVTFQSHQHNLFVDEHGNLVTSDQNPEVHHSDSHTFYRKLYNRF
jgi:hypothetical protein